MAWGSLPSLSGSVDSPPKLLSALGGPDGEGSPPEALRVESLVLVVALEPSKGWALALAWVMAASLPTNTSTNAANPL